VLSIFIFCSTSQVTWVQYDLFLHIQILISNSVTVTNIRICGGCNSRYMEIVTPSDSDADGDRVFKKIHDFTPEIEPSSQIDDE